jgi:hypothetical protein
MKKILEVILSKLKKLVTGLFSGPYSHKRIVVGAMIQFLIIKLFRLLSSSIISLIMLYYDPGPLFERLSISNCLKKMSQSKMILMYTALLTSSIIFTAGLSSALLVLVPCGTIGPQLIVLGFLYFIVILGRALIIAQHLKKKVAFRISTNFAMTCLSLLQLLLVLTVVAIIIHHKGAQSGVW